MAADASPFEQKSEPEEWSGEAAAPPAPCDWDNADHCAKCKDTRCPNCTRGTVCENCDYGAPRMCFAFCDFNDEICSAQKHMDFELWQETYAAVRCLRDRIPPGYGKSSQSERDKYIKTNFPGFCRQHNSTDYYREFVQRFWIPLEWKYKALTNFMVMTDRCGINNIDPFLYEQTDPDYRPQTAADSPTAPLFRDTTLFDILDKVLLTPVGIMAVDPMYFHVFLVQIVEKKYEEHVFAMPALRAQLVGKSLEELENFDAGFWVQEVQNELPKLRLSYDFVLDAILQVQNIEWLMARRDGDVCRHLFHWNMLVHKLTVMFTFGFFPVDFRPSLPFFSYDWRVKWDAKATQFFSQFYRTPQEYSQFMNGTWKDFMDSMELIVRTIESSAEGVPTPDPRPDPNVYPLLTQCKQ